MKRLLTVLFTLLIISGISAQELPPWAKGLSGYALLTALRNNISPSTPVDNSTVMSAAIEIDCDIRGYVLNRFSSAQYRYDTWTSNALDTLHIVPSYWLDNTSTSLNAAMHNDLHNIFPCPADISTLIGNVYGPGYPEVNIRLDNGTITVGEKKESNIGVWEFPDKYKGELARAFMYMVSSYPVSMVKGYGINFIDHWSQLIILPSTARLLLDWHFANPPDVSEKERNAKIQSLQGNGNIFIEYPELARYIWDADNVDNGGENNDDNTDIIYLKGIYTDADDWIYLKSPYIPDNATWTIDGKECTELRLDRKSLASGFHVLEYSSQREKGKLIIKVQ